MSDLRSPKLIVFKGILFFAVAVLAAFLVLVELPSVRVAALLALLAWASARFYYFLFYVLERYVDPTMRYAGISNLILARLRQRAAKRQIGD